MRRRTAKLVSWNTATVVVLLVGGWLSLTYRPRWYRPAQVPPPEFQRVRDDFQEAVSAFTDHVVGGAPFVMELSQERVNEWLALRGEIWPGADRLMPAWMEDPMVVFESGSVRLAATARQRGVRTVLSVRATPRVENEWITLRISGIRGGVVPVPAILLRGILREITRSVAGEKARDAGGDEPSEPLALVNRFHWANGRRDFRVADIRVEPGRLILHIQPLTSSDRRR